MREADQRRLQDGAEGARQAAHGDAARRSTRRSRTRTSRRAGRARARSSDDEILVLLQKMVKQREESLAIYAKAGPRRPGDGRAGGDRHPRRVPAQGADRGRGRGGDQGRDRQDRRRRRQGHGQGDRLAEGRLSGPHRLRQGHRQGEGGAGLGHSAGTAMAGVAAGRRRPSAILRHARRWQRRCRSQASCG